MGVYIYIRICRAFRDPKIALVIKSIEQWHIKLRARNMDMEIDDADFCDIGEEVFEPEVPGPSRPNVHKKDSKVRGPEKSWVEVEKFGNAALFANSDIAKKLKEEFSLRKSREFEWADVKDYTCKFKRRVGYLACPMKMRVCVFPCS